MKQATAFDFVPTTEASRRVHVEGNGSRAKFWIGSPSLVSSRGYNRRQITEIRLIVAAHADEFFERWHEYFD